MYRCMCNALKFIAELPSYICRLSTGRIGRVFVPIGLDALHVKDRAGPFGL